MVLSCCKSSLLMKKNPTKFCKPYKMKTFFVTHVHKHCSINRTHSSENFFSGPCNYVQPFWWKLWISVHVMWYNICTFALALQIIFMKDFYFSYFFTPVVLDQKKLTASLQLWKWLNGLIKPSQYHHTAWNCPNIQHCSIG